MNTISSHILTTAPNEHNCIPCLDLRDEHNFFFIEWPQPNGHNYFLMNDHDMDTIAPHEMKTAGGPIYISCIDPKWTQLLFIEWPQPWWTQFHSTEWPQPPSGNDTIFSPLNDHSLNGDNFISENDDHANHDGSNFIPLNEYNMIILFHFTKWIPLQQR